MTHTFIPDDIRLNINKRNSFDGFTLSEKSPMNQATQDGYGISSGLSGLGTPIHKVEVSDLKFPFPSDSPEVRAMTSDAKCQDLEMSALKLDVRNTDPPASPGHRKAGDIAMIEAHLKNKQKEIKVRGALPKKPLIISSILLFFSVVLMVAGTYLAIQARNGLDGLVCWIVGLVCGLPGLFYTIKFFKVCYAQCEVERQKAIDDLPQE